MDNKVANIKDIQIGDTIKIYDLTKIEFIRDNDHNHDDIEEKIIFGDPSFVVGKNSKSITVAHYDGDWFYVIKIISGKFETIGHCENTKKGAVYYKEDYFGYVTEDNDYVYLVHYYVWNDGKSAMRKVNKNEYYKYAISIDTCDYSFCYKPEWGLEWKESR